MISATSADPGSVRDSDSWQGDGTLRHLVRSRCGMGHAGRLASWAVWVLALTLGAGCAGEEGDAPVLKNLQAPTYEMPIGFNDGVFMLWGVVDFEDPNRDIVLQRVSTRDCGVGPWEHLDTAMSNLLGMAVGYFMFFAEVSTDCPPGAYGVQVSVFDSQGLQSEILTLPYEICSLPPCRF